MAAPYDVSTDMVFPPYSAPYDGRVTSLIVSVSVTGAEVGIEFTHDGVVFGNGVLLAGNQRVQIQTNKDFEMGDLLGAHITYVTPGTAPPQGLMVVPRVAS